MERTDSRFVQRLMDCERCDLAHLQHHQIWSLPLGRTAHAAGAFQVSPDVTKAAFGWIQIGLNDAFPSTPQNQTN
jgi:hypothetical protein